MWGIERAMCLKVVRWSGARTSLMPVESDASKLMMTDGSRNTRYAGEAMIDGARWREM